MQRPDNAAFLILATIIIVLTAVGISACSSKSFPSPTAAGNIPNTLYATINNGTNIVSLDGTTPAQNFSSQTTDWLNIGGASEVAIWVNCSSPVNFSALKYQYSMDKQLIQNGSTGLPGCYLNLTKIDISDKAMGYIRFIITTNGTGNATTNGTIVMVSTR